MGNFIRRINNLFKNPRRSFYVAILEINHYYPNLISDKLCLKAHFYLRFGYELDLKHPSTFSEKLQWLKLYDRRTEYTKMVDKYEAKKYAASIIGEEYIIPTLGVWDRAEDIEWDRLPDQFVLKCTHDSGDLIICKDKSTLDKENAIKKLNEGLKRDYYMVWREWPYKNVHRRIIAETYVEPRPDTKDLPDYKFFCFDGEVKGLFVATERQNPNEEVKFDFFDADFNHLPFRQGHDHAKVTPKKPGNFELMKRAAEQLSKGIPQVRVDLYDLGDKVLFGELTLFHFSGMVPFEPEEWDKRFGEMLTLPGEKVGGGKIVRLLTDGTLQISSPDLTDYKWFCFNGEPKYCQVIQNRSTNETIDFFDVEWNHQDFIGLIPPTGPVYKSASRAIACPKNLAIQINIAKELSKNIPFARIDVYNVEEKIYFGEITLYPMSGMGGFKPEEYNQQFGDMLSI